MKVNKRHDLLLIGKAIKFCRLFSKILLQVFKILEEMISFFRGSVRERAKLSQPLEEKEEVAATSSDLFSHASKLVGCSSSIFILKDPMSVTMLFTLGSWYLRERSSGPPD